MTQKEAFDKWCPMARVMNGVDSLSHNRYGAGLNTGDLPEGAECWGPGCAVWRWLDSEHKSGYCGLGGRP